MNKFMKAARGVTLLEVMLVLAIAAMIIVMSVRYYQSAQQSSQANAFAAQVQAIAGVAENLASGSTFATVTSANVQAALPANSFNVPWGGTIAYAPSANGFTLSGYGTPSAATCALIVAKFPAGGKVTVAAPCTTVTYDATN